VAGKHSKLGRKIKILKIDSSANRDSLDDIIPAELLLTVSLNGRSVSTLSCSPENLIELAVGFLLNNGYVQKYSDINLLRFCGEDMNRIIGSKELSIKIEVTAKNVNINTDELNIARFISSGCGSIDDLILRTKLIKIKSKIRVRPDIILKLNLETNKSQKLKKEFGGLHSAALFDVAGNLLKIVEDLGRHNCIDKIAGFLQLKKLSSDDKIIFTTGRLSIDLIYKIARMYVPVLVTNSSITHSAATLAKKIGLTTVGYARGGRFNIYANPRRILT
jgi:FdhD protein